MTFAFQGIADDGSGGRTVAPWTGTGSGGSSYAPRYVGDTQPDTSGWAANDWWLDTSTAGSGSGDFAVPRIWDGADFMPPQPGAPAPSGSLLLSDDWSGADGTAWNFAKWGPGRPSATGSGSGSTLLSGTGILAASSSTTNYDPLTTYSRKGLLIGGDVADAHVYFRFKMDASSGSFGVHLRHSTDLIDRQDGYWVQCFKPTNTWTLGKLAGYNTTTLGAEQTIAWADNAWYFIRFKCQGTTIKAKVWLQGTTEPSTWTVQVTDSTYTSAGKFGVSMSSGIASSLPTRVFLDDLVILDE